MSFSGTLQDLEQVTNFCLAQLNVRHGALEAEKLFLQISWVQALELYFLGRDIVLVKDINCVSLRFLG